MFDGSSLDFWGQGMLILCFFWFVHVFAACACSGRHAACYRCFEKCQTASSSIDSPTVPDIWRRESEKGRDESPIVTFTRKNEWEKRRPNHFLCFSVCGGRKKGICSSCIMNISADPNQKPAAHSPRCWFSPPYIAHALCELVPDLAHSNVCDLQRISNNVSLFSL